MVRCTQTNVLIYSRNELIESSRTTGFFGLYKKVRTRNPIIHSEYGLVREFVFYRMKWYNIECYFFVAGGTSTRGLEMFLRILRGRKMSVEIKQIVFIITYTNRWNIL